MGLATNGFLHLEMAFKALLLKHPDGGGIERFRQRAEAFQL